MIKVNLSELVNAKVGHRDSVDLDLEDLVVADLHLGYLVGELKFIRVANGILVEGELEASVETECTRCLETFFKPIVIELEDIINLPGAELTQENPVRVADNGWVNLSPLIREYAWIGLPINPVCSPDCQGLCPECGGNLSKGECTCTEREPVDPRWEVLRVLLEQNEEG
jgi:uncharacterized protein